MLRLTDAVNTRITETVQYLSHGKEGGEGVGEFW